MLSTVNLLIIIIYRFADCHYCLFLFLRALLNIYLGVLHRALLKSRLLLILYYEIKLQTKHGYRIITKQFTLSILY